MYVTGAPYSARGFELPSAYVPKGSGFLTQMERTQAAACKKVMELINSLTVFN